MKLYVIEDSKLREYEATCNKEVMNEFINQVIRDYGIFEPKVKRVTNKHQIFDGVDDCINAELLKETVDNSKIKQGRKRVARKTPLHFYTYSFTTVMYPEIYFTINNFLRQGTIDLTIFNKYLKAREDINYDHIEDYINERYKYDNYAKRQLGQSLSKNKDIAKQFIDEVINKREQQGKCLSRLYDLFDKELISEYPIIKVHDTIIPPFNMLTGYIEAFAKIRGYDYSIHNILKSFSSEAQLANTNSDLILKMKEATMDKVKVQK